MKAKEHHVRDMKSEAAENERVHKEGQAVAEECSELVESIVNRDVRDFQTIADGMEREN